MPGGWDFNPWALSPWGADPARDAGRDTGLLAGRQAAPKLADVLQPPIPVKNPDDYGPADWSAYFASDWPDVPNVIPTACQVLERDRETVKTWVNSRLAADKQRSYVVCYHFAKYQMHRANHTFSGPPALDEESMLVIREYRERGGGTRQEIWLDQAIKSVTYIRDSLVAGIPVVLGVKLGYYDEEPNNLYHTPYIVATDHFVVAVGTGIEDGKAYVNIYDYLETYNERYRLFLTPLMTLESDDLDYQMIETRRSYPGINEEDKCEEDGATH
jgi:hypothetical protein